MRLTTKSRYGMRLMLDLASHAQNGPVALSDVASRQNVSIKYLERLVQKLRSVGLVKSSRGPFGGYELARDPHQISAGDIVRTLEEHTAITDCAEKPDQVCDVCHKSGDCLAQWVWIEASRAMFTRLDEITVGFLIDHADHFDELKQNKPT